MKVLFKLIDWILYTSVFAATCALAMCMATERLLLNDIPSVFTPLHTLIFGATLTIYNTHFLLKKSTPELSDRFGWAQHYRFWHFGGLVTGFLIACISLLLLPLNIFCACVVLGILSFAYSIPLLPFKDKKRLKDFGWVKLLVLASVWTIVTAILPMLYWQKSITDYPYEIMIRFVFMLSLCIAFDIRDMQTDLESNIYTLPNLIGIKNSYRLTDLFTLLFVALSIIQYLRYPSHIRLMAELITALAVKIVILYTKKHTSDRIYLGLVDGVMLLYGVLVML